MIALCGAMAAACGCSAVSQGCCCKGRVSLARGAGNDYEGLPLLLIFVAPFDARDSAPLNCHD